MKLTNAGLKKLLEKPGRHGDGAGLYFRTLGGAPFPFSLRRSPLDGAYFPSDSPLCGRFTVRYIVSGDLEQARAARLKIACEGKIPTLAKWKHDSGAPTVLVLKEDDLSLTNHFRVADALVQVDTTTPDAPD